MNAFAAAVDALFADPHLGRDAVYTGAGGSASLVRAMLRRADDVAGFGEARIWSETTRVDLRVVEAPRPRPGDRIEIDGEAFLVQGEPVRDRERLIWTLDLRPVEDAPAQHAIGSGDGTLFVIGGLSLAGVPVAGGEGRLEALA